MRTSTTAKQVQTNTCNLDRANTDRGSGQELLSATQSVRGLELLPKAGTLDTLSYTTETMPVKKNWQSKTAKG